jgi:McrBC 5-methylcytosine restriction system component
MSEKSEIPIKNIYYMLCYAWETLTQSDNIAVDSEEFNNIYDLLSKVLISGIKHLLKRGFYKEYADCCEELSLIRGKIDVSDSIKHQSVNLRKLICRYDEFTSDTPFNCILKFTIETLMKCPMLDCSLKSELARLLPCFSQIKELPPTYRNLSALKYNRNNQHYKILMNICELLYNGLISTENGNQLKFSDFIREKDPMAVLFEKFVRNFYKKHLPQPEFYIHAPHINWDCNQNFDNIGLEYLPIMRTDIVLENDWQNVQLIIDTKYYPEAFHMRNYGEKKKLISDNLYQIYTYVNNSNYDGAISGMLLYPTVDETLDLQYQIGGKIFMIKTLNLGADWDDIYNRLIEIAKTTASNRESLNI